MEHVKEQQSSVSLMPHVHPSTSQLNELQKEAFIIFPGTVNAKCCTDIKLLSGLSQNIPIMEKAFFEDGLAEEATWDSHHPHHACFANGQNGCLTSTPLKPPAKVREDNTLLPHQRRTSENTGNPTMYPPRYEMQMVAQEFYKLCKPKMNKLKAGYSTEVNLIFQSWIKHIRVHVEDLILVRAYS